MYVQVNISLLHSAVYNTTSLSQIADDHRLNNHELPASDFAPETLVLVQYATQPPTRKWLGPMQVISNKQSE